MPSPLTPLYTSSFLMEENTLPGHGTPVVRYSDHCATVQAKDKRIQELTHELERMALLCEDQAARLNRMEALKTYHENKPLDEFIGRVAGRWDDKGKLPGAL